MSNTKRESGVLLPIFSLPSKYGIGTLGKGAYSFVDFLSNSHVNIWQMLPLNLTSYGDSPYQSPSSNGLNYYFIDLPTLIHKKLLSKEDVENVSFSYDERHVAYSLLFANRIKVLKKAFSAFDTSEKDFQDLLASQEYNDFAFYMTMKERHSYKPWYEWKEESHYSPELEEKIKKEYHDTYLFYIWTQYEFLAEFHKLKEYAHMKGIRFMGDLPLYLALDSVEVYKYPYMFLMDEKHNPTVVAGCPPDYFNADGQLWGNPIYDWAYMEKTHYVWWNQRIERNLRLFDILRIDHFRGFADYYTIPFGAVNARKGKWVLGPGMKMFADKAKLPLVAEDLGDINDTVRKLLKDSGYPGMKVIEFALDGHKGNEHKPSNAKSNYVCYTGTHDNETMLGFIEHMDEKTLKIFKEDAKRECELLNCEYADKTKTELVRTIDRLCMASPCRLAVLPFADIAVYDNQARLNTPAILSDKNWVFRYGKGDFSEKNSKFLRDIIDTYR